MAVMQVVVVKSSVTSKCTALVTRQSKRQIWAFSFFSLNNGKRANIVNSDVCKNYRRLVLLKSDFG